MSYKILRCTDFNLSNFASSNDVVDTEVLLNLVALANRLEVIRNSVFYRRRISILSGIQIGSNKCCSDSKAHRLGLAADIVIDNVDSLSVYERLYVVWSGGLVLHDKFVHIDLGDYRRGDCRKLNKDNNLV